MILVSKFRLRSEFVIHLIMFFHVGDDVMRAII